jgi:hypothetical protein
MRRTGLVARTQVGSGAVAMAVLVLSAGSAVLLAGAAGGATASSPRMSTLGSSSAVTYWTGTTKYPGGSYELNFTDGGARLTYFFVGGQCKAGSETDTNFPASVPIIHDKFALNFTTHRARSDRTDPGFHVIIQGQINLKAGTAKGTLRILDDPYSGGACEALTGHWQAHNDTQTTG